MGTEQITEDLYGSFHFYLELETLNYGEREVVAGFNSISGGGVKVEKRDTTSGADPRRTHMPSAIEYDNLVLSRVVTQNRDLLDWMENIVNGDMDRRSGSVIQHDNAGEEIRRWDFFGAYPVSWAGPELSSEGSAVSIEKFELAIGEMRWVK